MTKHRELTAEDYLEILRRRWWMLIVLALSGAVAGYLFSLVLPKRYTSETVVLLDQPSVGDTYVKPVVTAELDQRLASMQEQIFSRVRLQHIIEQLGLYKEEINRVPMEALVERLHGSITVTPVIPMPGTRSKELPGFTISVRARTPRLAQQICTEVTSVFMEQDLRLRQHQAEDTMQFLAKQLNEAKAKLDEQDRKLAAFKRQYVGELLENEETNFNRLTGMIPQLEEVTQALNRAQQEKVFTESLLSQQLATLKSAPEVQNPQALEEQL